jgi:hypothetical protein
LLAAIVAGFAVGIALIFIMSVAADSQTVLRGSWVGPMLVANMRGEMRDFLEKYLDATLFVYLQDRCVPDCTPPDPIVEYYLEEGFKAASVRIVLDYGRVSFVQVNCQNTEDESDSATAYGPTPKNPGFPDVAGFLQDPRCP